MDVEPVFPLAPPNKLEGGTRGNLRFWEGAHKSLVQAGILDMHLFLDMVGYFHGIDHLLFFCIGVFVPAKVFNLVVQGNKFPQGFPDFAHAAHP